MMKSQRERIRLLLTDTIALLCRNGLTFESELRVQAVIGITVDKEESFVVHINKCFERNASQEEELKCENDEQLRASLQQVVGKLEQVEGELTQDASCSGYDMQPTREAPPCPSQESSHRPKSSNMSPRSQQNSSRHQNQVSGNSLSYNNCASKSDMPASKSGSSKLQTVNNCPEYNGSKTQQKISTSPVYIESDECDDTFSEVYSASQVFQQGSAAGAQVDCKQRSFNGGDMQQEQYYKPAPQNRSSHRYSADSQLRRADKMSNICQDLYNVEEDPCAQVDSKRRSFNGGDVQQDQYYKSAPQNRSNHRYSADSQLRRADKMSNLCEDLYDEEEDSCADFAADQQYSKTRKVCEDWQQQPQDVVVFDPRCTPAHSRQHSKNAVTSSHQHPRDPCLPRASVPVRKRPMALPASRRSNDSSCKPNSYEKVTITRFVCNECQMSFGYQSTLLNHQIRKHGRQKHERRGRPSKKTSDFGRDDDWC